MRWSALRKEDREYAIGLSRAFAGAVIFSLPLLMTMEMWWLGFYLDRTRLLLFILLNFFILVGLSRVAGFEQTSGLAEDIADALAAYAVAVAASAMFLLLFGVIGPGLPADEIIGKIAIQSIPASFGAMISTKELGIKDEQEETDRRTSYLAQLFLMLAGALFLAFNVAPTEEMVLIAYQMSPWHGMATVLVSITLLHALVYTVGFSGQEAPFEDDGFARTFVRFSIVGYGIAVGVSFYVLWTFGRIDGVDAAHVARMTAVLGFPAAVGAGIARLVI